MSSRRTDAEYAGRDEQNQPYKGKHRAPESKFRSLERSVVNMVLGQPATSPDPLPDTPGSDSAEERVDQQCADGQESADGLGESSHGFAEAPLNIPPAEADLRTLPVWTGRHDPRIHKRLKRPKNTPSGPRGRPDQGDNTARTACRLRHRHELPPVTHAIDRVYRCRWRSRQVASRVDGVADRWPLGSVA
jgi:hypothetical protein